MSERELDKALAEAMGLSVSTERHDPDKMRVIMPGRKWKPLLHYSSSVDALVAGPEARLRAAEANLTTWEVGRGGRGGGTDEHAWIAVWGGHKLGGVGIVGRSTATEAEARAKAASAALKALDEHETPAVTPQTVLSHSPASPEGSKEDAAVTPQTTP